MRKAKNKTKFTTLDDVERELSSEDLMICNEKEEMCLAGVFGGSNSGVSNNTDTIFLESFTSIQFQLEKQLKDTD